MTVEHYWAPTTLPDALDHLRGGDVTILAGGTDLMPQSHAGSFLLGAPDFYQAFELLEVYCQ